MRSVSTTTKADATPRTRKRLVSTVQPIIAPHSGSDMAAANYPANQVLLQGRLGAAANERELPSGDRVMTFRLVVGPRPPVCGRSGARSATTVDTIDCAVWSPRLRRSVGSFDKGDVLEVAGSLRRRFWQSGGSPISRYEVEVIHVQRTGRATMDL
jgi:single-strand DNA-binding protein